MELFERLGDRLVLELFRFSMLAFPSLVREKMCSLSSSLTQDGFPCLLVQSSHLSSSFRSRLNKALRFFSRVLIPNVSYVFNVLIWEHLQHYQSRDISINRWKILDA
jgi:hypothetical protein